MTQLPATLLDEDQAINFVGQQVSVIEKRMTAEYSREWLEAMLRWQLQQGLIETLQVIQWADDGDELADSALRRVYAEMRDRGEEPPATLKAYGIKAVLRGPVTRRAGRNMWFDNWRRDIGISLLVYLTSQRFGLRPTRNREQRRRQQPSACSIVSTALGRGHFNIAEKRVENIWGRLRGHVAAFLAQQKESPLILPS
jgi:hypothetical protein